MSPDLSAKAKTIRKLIITSTTTAGSGHPTSSMSAVEVAVALYFGGIMNYDPKKPDWADRDRFILSKGHAAPLLYAILAEAGYFPVEDLQSLRKLGSPYEGHPNMKRLPGVEASTGSLGQGLSIGVGHAFVGKMDKKNFQVYVLMGDGEINQGQVWEAAMAAKKYNLHNLTAIIDHNGYQQTGASSDVLDLRPIGEKWAAFGWAVQDVDGHDQEAVLKALNKAKANKNQPSVIVAKTVKGFPVIDLLSDQNYHGKALPPDVADQAIAQIMAA